MEAQTHPPANRLRAGFPPHNDDPLPEEPPDRVEDGNHPPEVRRVLGSREPAKAEALVIALPGVEARQGEHVLPVAGGEAPHPGRTATGALAVTPHPHP